MVSRWDRRTAVLARHVDHPLQGVDERSVRCTSCAVVLLLDANREAPDELQAPARTTATGQPLRACYRCGRRVPYMHIDGTPEPAPHLRPAGERMCADQLATLPPGGWRALVAAANGEPARPADDPRGT